MHLTGGEVVVAAAVERDDFDPEDDGQGWLSSLTAISVDTKKKELVGDFKNGGREWQPTGEPERVRVHDFPGDAVGKAIPYGVYDMARNEAWVSVGRDHDTPAFAVASIRQWWTMMGRQAYPVADALYITADAGGSNGYRTRGWKPQCSGGRTTCASASTCRISRRHESSIASSAELPRTAAGVPYAPSRRWSSSLATRAPRPGCA